MSRRAPRWPTTAGFVAVVIMAVTLAAVVALPGCVIRDMRAECEGTHQPSWC